MVTVQNNAQKFTYLAKLYPEKDLLELMKSMPMSALDINTAIWYAEQKGWVVIDKEATPAVVKEVHPPGFWDFGPDFAEFTYKIMIAFHQWEREEKDLDEFNLLAWLYGNAPQDVMIGIDRLLESKAIVKYTITDADFDGKGGESEYTFYTLPQNLDKQWGKKAFKVDPTKAQSKKKDTQTLH